MTDHNHSISFNTINETASYYYNRPAYPEWVYRKEDEMTTLDKIHKERKEAAERERIEQTYETLDAQDLGGLVDGAVLRFDAIDEGKVFTYAALHYGGRWWATGGTAPNGVGLEDLLAWMIRKHIDVETLVVL